MPIGLTQTLESSEFFFQWNDIKKGGTEGDLNKLAEIQLISSAGIFAIAKQEVHM